MIGNLRSALPTLLVVCCLVLAGCTGGTGQTETTAKTIESTSTATDATTNTATTTDESAKTASRSETTVETANGSTAERLAAAHAASLRAASSFTYRQRVSLTGSKDGKTETLALTETARVDATANRVLVRENVSGMKTTRTYVSAAGDTYQRTEIPNADIVQYDRPVREYSVEAYRNRSVGSFLRAFEFESAGTATRDGRQVRVYEVTSLEQVRHPDANVTRFDPADVTAIELRLFVADSGLIESITYRVEATVEGERRTFRYRIAYDDVGDTDVSPPSWLDEAEEATAERTTVPDPSREVTETVSTESVGAAVTVEGPKYLIDDVEVTRETREIFDTDGEGYREAQVSTQIRIQSPAELTLRTLELSYNESAIPGAAETNFTVFRYNRSLQTYLPVPTTVDEEANVARAEIEKEGTYLVMDVETWLDLWS